MSHLTVIIASVKSNEIVPVDRFVTIMESLPVEIVEVTLLSIVGSIIILNQYQIIL